MKVIAFLTDYAVVDRIINHLKLTFVADKTSPTAYRLPGNLDGRRHWRRIFFMTYSLAERRGLADFRRFLPCPRLVGPFRLVSAQFDIR